MEAVNEVSSFDVIEAVNDVSSTDMELSFCQSGTRILLLNAKQCLQNQA